MLLGIAPKPRAPASHSLVGSFDKEWSDGKLGVANTPDPEGEDPCQRQYVAIELHRWRSLLMRENESGQEAA